LRHKCAIRNPSGRGERDVKACDLDKRQMERKREAGHGREHDRRATVTQRLRDHYLRDQRKHRAACDRLAKG
jgi:hypothetical protein